MNKFYLTFCFCLSFLLLLSCERPDLSDELNFSWSSVNCTTIDGYTWSPPSSEGMEWDDAVSYCDNLAACGYSDWHLPTISELRTLVKNCKRTKAGGSCGVTDSCLSYDCWSDECYGCDDGHSKLGDFDIYWSSSTLSDSPDQAWCVFFFSYANVRDCRKKDDYRFSFRCVR